MIKIGELLELISVVDDDTPVSIPIVFSKHSTAGELREWLQDSDFKDDDYFAMEVRRDLEHSVFGCTYMVVG